MELLFPNNYPMRDFMYSCNAGMGDQQLPIDVLDRFYDTLILHIACVQEAGVKLGVPRHQLAVHDMSKFHKAEFYAYARHFQAGGSPQEFALAWLNHLHKNPHHWQYWIFPDGHTPKDTSVENGMLPMPEEFALEMLCDWQGASKAYTGSEDMSRWLLDNIPRISLHSETVKLLRQWLTELGYSEVVNARMFKSEMRTIYDRV